MPKFSSYVKRDGTVEPAYNLSIYDKTDPQANGAQGYKEFVLKIRKEQPMLYNTLRSDQGITNANITDKNSLTQYITKNTFDLTTGTGAAKETEVDENMYSQGNVSSESSGKVIITGNVQPIAQGMPMQQSIAVVGGSAAVGGSVSAESTQEMEEATNNYVEELKRLTTMLSAVADQSQRLTRDSEEMENLNRTLTGISRVYEMQLKSASAQMGTIDEINEQSKRMAEQIAELNKIYARMIEAVKVRA